MGRLRSCQEEEGLCREDNVYHVLNRGVGRRRLFDKPQDYEAFEEKLRETLVTRPMRVWPLLVPNHWHFVLCMELDGELALHATTDHFARDPVQKHRHKVGETHLYQGRFKSFSVEPDEHLYQVMVLRRAKCIESWTGAFDMLRRFRASPTAAARCAASWQTEHFGQRLNFAHDRRIRES